MKIKTTLVLICLFAKVYAQWVIHPDHNKFGDAPYNSFISSVIAKDTGFWAVLHGSGVVNRIDSFNSGIRGYASKIFRDEQDIWAIASQKLIKWNAGANSWNGPIESVPGASIFQIVDFGGVKLAATHNYGLFRSTDGGETWSSIVSGFLDNNIRGLAVFQGRFYAFGQNVGLKQSIDGLNWNFISSPGNFLNLSSGKYLYAQSGIGKIWLFNGLDWIEKSNPPTDSISSSAPKLIFRNGILFHFQNLDLYFADDEVTQWTRVNLPDKPIIADMDFNGSQFYIAGSSGLLKSNGLNDTNWQQVSFRFSAVFNVLSSEGDVLLVNERNRLFFDQGDGILNPSVYTITTPIAQQSAFGRRIFHYTSAKIEVSDNGGRTFRDFTSGHFGSGNFIIGFSNHHLVYLINDLLYVEDTTTNSFKSVRNTIDWPHISSFYVNDSVMYLGAMDGLYKTELNWRVGVSIADESLPRRFVQQIIRYGSRIYIRLGIDTYYKKDETENWIMDRFDRGDAFAEGRIIVDGDWAFVKTQYGYLRCHTSDYKWEIIHPQPPNYPTSFTVAGDKLWAGGQGLYSLDLKTLSHKTAESRSQINIYPNPVRDFLNFSGDVKGNMMAKILDLSGRLLIEEYLTEGNNSFDVGRLKPGMYLLHLQSENILISRLFTKL